MNEQDGAILGATAGLLIADPAGLSWPAAVILLALIFRAEFSLVMRRRGLRIRVPGFEAEIGGEPVAPREPHGLPDNRRG